MISKYRNKAIIQISAGMATILVGFIIYAALSTGEWKKLGQFLCVISNIIGYVFFSFGCVELVKAKGYDASIILAFLIMGLCCHLFIIVIAPLVIIFGLKDKTRHRKRRSH